MTDKKYNHENILYIKIAKNSNSEPVLINKRNHFIDLQKCTNKVKKTYVDKFLTLAINPYATRSQIHLFSDVKLYNVRPKSGVSQVNLGVSGKMISKSIE